MDDTFERFTQSMMLRIVEIILEIRPEFRQEVESIRDQTAKQTEIIHEIWREFRQEIESIRDQTAKQTEIIHEIRREFRQEIESFRDQMVKERDKRAAHLQIVVSSLREELEQVLVQHTLSQAHTEAPIYPSPSMYSCVTMTNTSGIAAPSNEPTRSLAHLNNLPALVSNFKHAMAPQRTAAATLLSTTPVVQPPGLGLPIQGTSHTVNATSTQTILSASSFTPPVTSTANLAHNSMTETTNLAISSQAATIYQPIVASSQCVRCPNSRHTNAECQNKTCPSCKMTGVDSTHIAECFETYRRFKAQRQSKLSSRVGQSGCRSGLYRGREGMPAWIRVDRRQGKKDVKRKSSVNGNTRDDPRRKKSKEKSDSIPVHYVRIVNGKLHPCNSDDEGAMHIEKE